MSTDCDLNAANGVQVTDAYRQVTITDLPEVVLEYILSHLSLHGHLLTCRLVCKSWRRCVNATIERSKREFRNALRSCNVEWTDYHTTGGPNISGRYSHSCCLYRNVMFIFGGCTVANTTFNDLWTFDLSERQWVRPLVTGNYPPPKACASLVKFKDCLILYGGWTHSSPHPLHQDWKLFDEMHKFDIRNNRWSIIAPRNNCPSVAGHFANVVNNEMIVFGGLISDANIQNSFIPSNDVWVFNFDNCLWRKQVVSTIKPAARYGHSQVVVDDNHILVFGGCGGPNMLFNDVWLLRMEGEVCHWKEIEVRFGDSTSLPVIGFNPTCKVDDLVVFLHKNQVTKTYESLKENPITRKPMERKQYPLHSHQVSVNNKLQPQPSKQERRQQLLGCSSKPSIKPNSRLDRQKQLHYLNKMEQRLKDLKSTPEITLSTVKQHPQRSKEFMSMYVLDISKAVVEGFLECMPHERQHTGPQEKKLYSLVPSQSEIIMFGGVERNVNGMINEPNSSSHVSDIVSNTVHIASFKKTVI